MKITPELLDALYSMKSGTVPVPSGVSAVAEHIQANGTDSLIALDSAVIGKSILDQLLAFVPGFLAHPGPHQFEIRGYKSHE